MKGLRQKKKRDNPMSLRQSTAAEVSLQASKWLKVQALLGLNELQELFAYLKGSVGDFVLYSCGGVCKKEEGEISKQTFLERYGNYLNDLQTGQTPDLNLYRSLFSPAMTTTTEALYALPIGQDRQIIRVAKPVVQLQAHNLDYSTEDKKFHSMIFGMDSVSWGIQFSYPQLYQDNETKQVEMVRKGADFPNTALFQAIQKWMRQNTIPTPFLAEGVLTNVPARLGKECFSWINRHPQLIKKNISVKLEW
jgi:hypothetical protein